METQNKTAGKTATKSIRVTELQRYEKKDYYYVIDIDELKDLIKKCERENSEEQLKKGSATIVIRFRESKKYKGQLENKEMADKMEKVDKMIYERKIKESN